MGSPQDPTVDSAAAEFSVLEEAALHSEDPELLERASLSALELGSTAVDAENGDAAHRYYTLALKWGEQCRTAKGHAAAAIAGWQLHLTQDDPSDRDERPTGPNLRLRSIVRHALEADDLNAISVGVHAASLLALDLEHPDREDEALSAWNEARALSLRLPPQRRDLATALGRFAAEIHHRRGEQEEAEELITFALEHAEACADAEQRLWAAHMEFSRGQASEDAEAAPHFARAFHLAMSCESPSGLGLAAAALHRHTVVCSHALRPEEQVARFRKASELGSRSDDSRGMQWAMMALVQVMFGDFEGSRGEPVEHLRRRAIELGRRSGTPFAMQSVSRLECDAGFDARREGRPEEARLAFERALEAVEEVDTPEARAAWATARVELALHHLDAGNAAEAHRGLAAVRELALRQDEAALLPDAARAAWLAGKLVEAKDGHAAAEIVYGEAAGFGARSNDPDARAFAARASLRRGLSLKQLLRTEEAVAAFRLAVELCSDGDPGEAGEIRALAMLELGQAQLESKQFDQALAAFADAIECGRMSRSTAGIRTAAHASHRSAEMLKSMGRWEEARQHWSLVRSLAQRLGLDDEGGSALDLLAMIELQDEE